MSMSLSVHMLPISESPFLCFVCPFPSILLAGCWVFRSSFAEKCCLLRIYTAWPAAKLNSYIEGTFSSGSFLFHSLTQPFRKDVSSDWWAGHPSSTYEWVNQKGGRHLLPFKLLCKVCIVHVCSRIFYSLLWKWIIFFLII